MAKYIHTGKINFPKTTLAFAIAIPLAVLIGWGYGFLMEFCSFIILDLIILLVVIALLAATAAGLPKIGNIRNKAIKFVLALLVSSLAWYTSWVYLVNQHFFEDFLNFGDTFSNIAYYLNNHSISIGRMISSASFEIEGVGLWIIAVIEALLFLVPLFFALDASKDYFCENCQKFNLHQKFYIHAPHNQSMLDSAEFTGNFKELDKFPRLEEVPELHGSLIGIDNVYEMDLSYCRSCKHNGVINLNRGNYNISDKKVNFESKEKVIRDVLVDDSTVTTFMNPEKEGEEFIV